MVTTDFFSAIYSFEFKLVLVYRVEKESIKNHLLKVIKEINLKPIMTSAVSMVLVPTTSFGMEDLIRLREIKFNRMDIVELVFRHNNEISFARLKKEGNRTLSLSELKNAMGRFTNGIKHGTS